MNPFHIASGTVWTRTIPLKVPFITALGRKDATTNAFIEIRLRGGHAGQGEASGSVVMAHLSAKSLAGALSRLLKGAVGKDIRRWTPLLREGWAQAARTPAAAAAFECALTGALLSQMGIPMHIWFGGAKDSVTGGLTLSASGTADTEQSAARAAAEGFGELKIKVGTGPEADLARVLAADRAGRRGGRRPRILLDGNQRLGHKEALRLLDRTLAKGIRVVLLEQPFPADHLEAARRLRQECPVPLAADESVRSVDDARRVLEADAADIINIKIAKTGINASRDIMALTLAAGKKLMIGCMQETALGLSPSVHLAAGAGTFDYIDLDSDHLLGPGQPCGDYQRRGPRLSVPRG